MCTNLKPIAKSGKYKEDNYHAKKGEEYMFATYTKCGNCEQCINEKANNWVVRNYYESMQHEKMCFITLTYANNPYFLIKSDLQKFMKRLRFHIDKKERKKIKFFAAGEYGERTNRPHYHIIIYGWNDEKAEIIRINKKNNPIYKSELITKCWKYGITSYQPFEKHEIPYISLYNTARETEKHQYILSRKKAKELLEKLKKEKGLEKRLYIIKELNKEIKKIDKEKKNYITIKEFNTWSQALGWESFYEKYVGIETYDWKEYIDDKEYVTPTPWVKKLANRGNKNAIKEMLRRLAELNSEGKMKNEINNLKKAEQHIKDILDKSTDAAEKEL